ncbi:pantoate--beta-alanine ligase [Pseudomonas sp. SDO55104_S430]
MEVIHTIKEMRNHLNYVRNEGKTISFVSTMGALHAGHIDLVRHGKEISDFTVAGVFLNPSHFAEGEDYDKYPRTLETDCFQLNEAGCDIVFAPSVKEMYPLGLDHQANVTVPFLSDQFCGKTRPHFFGAIATIVTKLLNVVQPDYSLFGEKDFQQLAVCRRLVETLNIPTHVVGVPTVRDTRGLALSSRNGYLNDTELEQASYLYQVLLNAKRMALEGNFSYSDIESESLEALIRFGFKPDYFNCADALTLDPASETTSNLVILCAAHLNNVRLIDNITFSNVVTSAP